MGQGLGIGALGDKRHYEAPAGQVGLTGPVDRPEPGTLPVRGDLAHVALAERYLVPHYAVPNPRVVGSEGAALYLAADDESEMVAMLDGGTVFEALDYAGDWCWGALGPDGPSGWVETRLLEA